MVKEGLLTCVRLDRCNVLLQCTYFGTISLWLFMSRDLFNTFVIQLNTQEGPTIPNIEVLIPLRILPFPDSEKVLFSHAGIFFGNVLTRSQTIICFGRHNAD